MTLDPNNCIYFGCTSKKNDQNEDVAFFKLPSSEDLCKKWIGNGGRYDKFKHLLIPFDEERLSQFVVCEKHFDPKDILVNNRRKLLFRNVVPIPFKEIILRKVVPISSKPTESSKETECDAGPKFKVCCATNCSNISSPDGGSVLIVNNRVVTFHKFLCPGLQNYEAYVKWVDNLGLDKQTFKWNDHRYVCSEHFRREDFVRKGSTYELVPDAIPINRIRLLQAARNSSKGPISYCDECILKQKDLTNDEKRKVKYYHKRIQEYYMKYETQCRRYTKKIAKEKSRIESLDNELKSLTETVDTLKKSLEES